MVDTAFILAAGKGTRMVPLTDSLPKPLVPLAGRPLLDYVFDHLRRSGVKRVVVNSFHHADVLRHYLETVQGFDVVESPEEILLETGGGLKKAAPLLGDSPFLMINGDAFWRDGLSGSALDRLENFFDDEKMDILLLLIPVDKMTLTAGVGDYVLAEDASVKRSKDQSGTHMFTGIRIVHPRVLAFMPDGVYSFLQQMDAAQEKGRLFAVEHDGEWHHISTPEDLTQVEKDLVKSSY